MRLAGKISNVIPYGLDIADCPKSIPPARWIKKPIEHAVVPGYFDVIQSHCGLVHAEDFALALENLLNSLRQGGVLILREQSLFYGHLGAVFNRDYGYQPDYDLRTYPIAIQKIEALIDTLRTQGITLLKRKPRFRRDVAVFLKTSKGPVDLKGHYGMRG